MRKIITSAFIFLLLAINACSVSSSGDSDADKRGMLSNKEGQDVSNEKDTETKDKSTSYRTRHGASGLIRHRLQTK